VNVLYGTVRTNREFREARVKQSGLGPLVELHRHAYAYTRCFYLCRLTVPLTMLVRGATIVHKNITCTKTALGVVNSTSYQRLTGHPTHEHTAEPHRITDAYMLISESLQQHDLIVIRSLEPRTLETWS
jgi:hypothetical protein